MLSKNRIKFLSSLSQKKSRESSGYFLAEGEKMVSEILLTVNNLLNPIELLATDEFLSSINHNLIPPEVIITPVQDNELNKISALSNPNKAALLVRIPDYKPDSEEIADSVILAFENIRDPGNLGTIVRTSDWFGIKDIFCSRESVDLFNPKTIQSTMGAISRVRVHYTDLEDSLRFYKENYGISILGTLLDGDNIGENLLPEKAIIVFGNESQGISDKLKNLIDYCIKIPSFPPHNNQMESLNIASSVAIVCWEIRRRALYSK